MKELVSQKDKLGFTIKTTGSGRDFNIRASSADERIAWIDAITNVRCIASNCSEYAQYLL
jgi:hypothetical protein